MALSHHDLCKQAVKWLQLPACRKGPGCQFAVSESRTGYSVQEIPDAIGFRAGLYGEGSVLVEVKMSRADFLADAKKPHRQEPASGMGLYRYYLSPQGLISPDELPPKWGLVEVTPKGWFRVRCGHVLLRYGDEDVWRHERSLEREWSLLACMVNRVADPEKVQQWLKEASTRTARLAKEVEALREENRKLKLDLVRAVHGAAATPGLRARPRARPMRPVPSESTEDALDGLL